MAASGYHHGSVPLYLARCGALIKAFAQFGGMSENSIGHEGSKYGIEQFLDVKIAAGRHRPLSH